MVDLPHRYERTPGVLGALLACAGLSFLLHGADLEKAVLSSLGLLTIIAWFVSGFLGIWATVRLDYYRAEQQALAGKQLKADLLQFAQCSLLRKRWKWVLVRTYSVWLFMVSTLSCIAVFVLAHSGLKALSDALVFPTPLLAAIFCIKGGIELYTSRAPAAG